MASNARKELAKALRVAFGADNSSKDTHAPPSFEDYAPPEALLDAIDEWANSSAVQSSTTERDIAKLKETLLEHCFEQGTITETGSPERSTQAKSAFLVVLDRFSSLDSEVVTVKEIREIWWNRLILPALTLPDTASDSIRLGRPALKAAKDMAIRALNSVTEHASNTEGNDISELERTKPAKWTLSVFRTYLLAASDSSAQKNLQSVLIAFGKSHPRDFFFTISELLDRPVEALGLLNHFIRLHPIQAYQALQTPLFSKVIAMLDSLPVSFSEEAKPSSEEIGERLVVISAALCTLNMIMPRLPTSLDKLLDRFFIILARCLLWYDAVVQIVHPLDNGMTDDEEDDDEADSPSRKERIHAAPILAPLLDYFTQLYGLFPANLLSFLSTPTRWLQSYYRRMRKRRHRVPSSANLSALGRDALLRPIAAAGGLTTYSSSSTSADEDASATDLPISGAEEGDVVAGQLRRKRTSTKSGGRKGQRSKTNKARRDVAAKAKKEKDAAKQKERERRRRATNFLQNAPDDARSSEGSNIPFPTANVPGDASVSSIHSSGLLPSATQSDARTPKVRIAEPEAPSENEQVATDAVDSAVDHKEYHSTDSDESLSDTSAAEMQEIEEDTGALDLEGALAVFDWTRVKELSAPYLIQHVIVPGLMETTEVEFTRNKTRFKKLEASDLIDEITRTRTPQQPASTLTNHDVSSGKSVTSPPPSSLSTSTSMLGSSFTFEGLPENRQVLMLQSQLIFEIYQKNQLVQRLGSLLRERIATSGAEADKQNLMHQIRSLKSQLSHSQEKLEQLRHESALSRERLNKYSSDQSTRVEKLRGERQSLNAENNSLKAELAELKASMVALTEELAESRRECFDLKSERDYEAQLKEQKKKEEEEEKLKQEESQSQAAEEANGENDSLEPELQPHAKEDVKSSDLVASEGDAPKDAQQADS